MCACVRALEQTHQESEGERSWSPIAITMLRLKRERTQTYDRCDYNHHLTQTLLVNLLDLLVLVLLRRLLPPPTTT